MEKRLYSYLVPVIDCYDLDNYFGTEWDAINPLKDADNGSYIPLNIAPADFWNLKAELDDILEDYGYDCASDAINDESHALHFSQQVQSLVWEMELAHKLYAEFETPNVLIYCHW